MFDFLRRKKSIKNNEIRNLECNCKRKEDQKIVTAFSVNKSEGLEKFLKKNYYSFEIETERDYNLIPYNKFWIDNIVLGNIDRFSCISKKACISCGTCLGWEFNGENCGNNLDKYFEDIVSNHLNKISEEKREKELAKEICGIEE